MIHRIDRLASALQRRGPGFPLGLITGGWILLLLCLWLALGGLDDRWSPGIFVGRFHILVVHLPIGLLAGALVLEGLALFSRFRDVARGTVPMLWMALLGGVIATILGYTLMEADGFTGKFVTLHLWTGLGVVLLTALSLWLRLKDVRQPLYLGSLAATVILTGIAGHYGGNMVHGETYLTEFAPFQGDEPEQEIALNDRLIYDSIIQPIFDAKCVECHSEGKVKGDLRMDTYEWLARGGDYGPSFEPGDAEASELHYRVTIDPDEDDFMPPEGKGEPMTPGEIALLAWWINRGASPTMTIGEAEPDEAIRQELDLFFGKEAEKG